MFITRRQQSIYGESLFRIFQSREEYKEEGKGLYDEQEEIKEK
jgi:hypothetical protein